MRVDGLEEAQHDPAVHGQDVQIFRDAAPDDRRADCAGTEQHYFDRRGILGCEPERGRVLVVDLVDGLV